MGQAKAKRDRAKEIEGMSFPEQLQHYASRVVKEAHPLIDLGGAKWMTMEIVNGQSYICLTFSARIWALADGKLVLKQDKHESDTTIETQ